MSVCLCVCVQVGKFIELKRWLKRVKLHIPPEPAPSSTLRGFIYGFRHSKGGGAHTAEWLRLSSHPSRHQPRGPRRHSKQHHRFLSWSGAGGHLQACWRW